MNPQMKLQDLSVGPSGGPLCQAAAALSMLSKSGCSSSRVR
jgi:hypothetical protein